VSFALSSERERERSRTERDRLHGAKGWIEMMFSCGGCSQINKRRLPQHSFAGSRGQNMKLVRVGACQALADAKGLSRAPMTLPRKSRNSDSSDLQSPVPGLVTVCTRPPLIIKGVKSPIQLEST
jgi:hypothetical protein